MDKTKYFVNINTGEITVMRTEELYPSIFMYPQYNVDGWSEVSEELYDLLRRVYGYGYVDGVQDEIITNGDYVEAQHNSEYDSDHKS